MHGNALSRGGRRAPIAALVVLLALRPGASAGAPTIGELRVEGNARAEESLIFESFGLKTGEPYQIDRVRRGIRALYRLGLFRDVQVVGEGSPDSLVLTIHVRENPTLLRIRYDGAEKLDESDFKEVVELVPGQVVSPQDVDQARRDILDLYEEKGYLLAKVDPDLKGERRAELVFRIQEGKKVQVAKIRFSGNEHIPSEKLRDAMETKEDRWWRGGDFRREVFEEDKQRIVSRMGQEGFIDARIKDVRMTFSENKERLFLDIEVEEGTRYRLGRVVLDHGGVLPEDEIRSAILLREGGPFNTVLFEESRANLYSLFQEEGYIYASIEVDRIPRGDDVVDLHYLIHEGNPARIHRIVITGNTKTKEKVIRRELRAAPGDIFKRSKVIRSQREILQLGYFNDVRLEPRTADRETGAIDLILEVEERQTSTASLGAGVNPTAGVTGFAQISARNFLGNGQSLSFRGEFGRFRELEVSFTEPWLLDTPTSVGGDIFDTSRRYTEFTEKRRGGDLRIGHRLPWLDYTRAAWRYSLAEYRVEPEPGFEEEITNVEPSTISSVTLTLYRNSLDNPFFPTQGSITRLTNEIAGGVLGGDRSYHLGTFSTQSYFRTVGKFVLSLLGRVGFLNGLVDAEDVPFWRRFRLGGTAFYGLRGYGDYDVVPDENLPSTGGRSMMIMTAEVRYPIVRAVQGLVFFDAGNTWEGAGDMDLTHLRRGAGVGVRLDIPMLGQLGFDYGYGFDRTEREGGPGWEFHFQLGNRPF